VTSRVSLLALFSLITIFIVQLIPSVSALNEATATATAITKSSSTSKDIIQKTQLPLPTNVINTAIPQIIDGQDGASTNNFGNRIQGLNLPPGSVTTRNVITCLPLIPCIGTNKDDIVMGGISELIFGLKGNDIIFGAANDQVYGNNGNDIIMLGAGNSLADGGSGNDVLTGGIGHSLLIGGSGNDKLFAGPGDTVMNGGSGSNHFDCPASIAGLARSVVLDYNPSNGDTISGQCTLVNTVGNSQNNNNNVPNLPETGDTTSAGNTGAIAGGS
jgi:Ca2+-binding RTX toxin-like protein